MKTTQTAFIAQQNIQVPVKATWNKRWFVIAKAVAAVILLGKMAE